MGNSSSQVAASQAATQDVPLTSQPATQVPALDGTQDEDTQTLKRVDSNMDANVEDTVKKAKQARMKASRAHKKSVPQHTRGFAIQPSQEVPDTQEEARADAGAIDEHAQANAREKGGGDEIAVLQPTEPSQNEPQKAKTQRKKRLHWQEDDVEPTVDDVDAAPGALEELDVNTLDKGKSPPAKQKKRKRKDIELERLQKDVEIFSPELESTPKPKPVSKRQKRAKDVYMPEAIEEQPESEAADHEIVAHVKPQGRGKLAKSKVGAVSGGKDSGVDASMPTSTRRRPQKEATEPASVDPAGANAPKSTSQRNRKEQPITEPVDVADEVDEEDAVSGAEEDPPVDPNGEDPPVDSIPTPPESPDDPAPDPTPAEQDGGAEANVESDENGSEYSPAVAKVSQAALASTEKIGQSKNPKKRKRIAEAEDGEAEPAGDVDADQAKGAMDNKQKRSKPGKAKKLAKPDDKDVYEQNDDYQNDEDDDVDASDSDDKSKKPVSKSAQKSKKQKNATSDNEDATTSERGQAQGTWSKAERALADETFDDVVRVTAIPDWELKANIVDWRNPTPHLQQLKTALYEAFPQRSLKSIMRFCQRRYNAFERGKWTDEQDQLLREAYELFPDQWTDISDHVGRFWEDCRMRWRDTVSRSAAKVVTGPWSREEEVRLAKAVQECRELVIKETEDEEAREDPEKADALISWKVVADKMENTRNAKRCREKWSRIKNLDLSTNAAPIKMQPIKSDRSTKRLLGIEDDYQQCETGDIYDILTEICSAVPDSGRVFEHETTFWSVVSMKNPESIFKSALRRRAFAAAMKSYPCKALSEAETLAGKAQSVKERMEKLERKGKIEFGRAYGRYVKRKAGEKERKAKAAEAKKKSADEDGDAPAKKKRKTSKKSARQEDAATDGAPRGIAAEKSKQLSDKPKRARRTSAAKHKSADIIVDSDKEDNDNDKQDANGSGSDIRVAQTPADEADTDVDDDESYEGGGGEKRARQETEELASLGSRSPRLDSSTFVELCKGGRRVREGQGKGDGKKRKEGMKG